MDEEKVGLEARADSKRRRCILTAVVCYEQKETSRRSQNQTFARDPHRDLFERYGVCCVDHEMSLCRGGRGTKTKRFLTQAEAIAIDRDLFKIWSVDQLMELAGLSCACAIAKGYPTAKRVLVVAGPGNNGGDGLVAARHLAHFGYRPTVLYPKRPRSSSSSSTPKLFENLVRQCADLNIPMLSALDECAEFSSGYDVIVDGIFGFSFKGNTIRAPFDEIVSAINKSKLPVASIDIPSGWDVEKGNIHGVGVEPDTLISLTLPKMCARTFKGSKHYLGGRFVSPAFAATHGLDIPRYEGHSQIVRLT